MSNIGTDGHWTPEENPWPWPQSSATVFQGTPGIWGYGSTPETRVAWRLYAEGYGRAAENLYAQWSADFRCGSFLLFPIAYLYRHHVELRIKELLFVCAAYLQLPSDWRLNHDLDKFWKLLRPLLLQVSPTMPTHELDNVERIINELSCKDPGSFLFRYPASLDGRFHFGDLDALDLENYCSTLRELSRFLDCVSDCLQTELQIRTDRLDP